MSVNRQMLPLDDPALKPNERVMRALHNIDLFDRPGFEAWLLLDDTAPAIADVAKRCPPDRLYRLRGWGGDPLVCVTGYKPAGGGVAAYCIVVPLGSDRTLGAPPEALQDVTADARAGVLPEQQPITYRLQ